MEPPRNVETLVVLRPISIDTGSPDQAGHLVIANGLLVAILVRLDDIEHECAGKWFLEVGFGSLRELEAPIFFDLAEATRWIRNSLRVSRCDIVRGIGP